MIYVHVAGIAAAEVDQDARMTQIWMSGDEHPTSDVEALRSTATILQRKDDNKRVPDWIIEMAVHEDEHAIASWIARQPHTEATIVRWKRVA